MQQFDQVYKNTLEEFFRTYDFAPVQEFVWSNKFEALEPFFAEFVNNGVLARTKEHYLRLWEIQPILKFIFELMKTIWKLSADPYDQWLISRIYETTNINPIVEVEVASRHEHGTCVFCRCEGELIYGYCGIPLFDRKCVKKMHDIEQLLKYASRLVGYGKREVNDSRTESIVFLRIIKRIVDGAGIETE